MFALWNFRVIGDLCLPADGAAYALGRLNGDAWYLYTMENVKNPLQVADQTLEV